MAAGGGAARDPHEPETFARALSFEFVGEADSTYPDRSPRPVARFEMTRERKRRRLAAQPRERAERVCLERDADGR